MSDNVLDIKRREIKYTLPLSEALALADKLKSVLYEDKHNVPGGYMVKSLYLDSLDNSDFFDKLNGTQNRKKIRLRSYSNDARQVKLEMKLKSGESQQKISQIIHRQDAQRIINGDYHALDSYDTPWAKTLYANLVTQARRPTVMVEYNRLAFYHPNNEIRITVDSNIRCSEINFDLFDPHINYTPVINSGISVLEIKYTGFLFGYIEDVIKGYSKAATAVSKYANSRLFLID